VYYGASPSRLERQGARLTFSSLLPKDVAVIVTMVHLILGTCKKQSSPVTQIGDLWIAGEQLPRCLPTSTLVSANARKTTCRGLLAELAGCMLRIEGLKKKDNGFARNNTRSRW
jgi:hypothetical protein